MGNQQLHNTHITASSQSAGDDYYHPFHLHGSNTSQQLTGVAHYPTTLHCQPSSPCLQNYSPCNHYKLLQRRTEAHRKMDITTIHIVVVLLVCNIHHPHCICLSAEDLPHMLLLTHSYERTITLAINLSYHNLLQNIISSLLIAILMPKSNACNNHTPCRTDDEGKQESEEKEWKKIKKEK